MELSLRIPADDFDVDSLSSAVARFCELIGDHNDVRMVVTTDFVTEVRQAIVDDPEYAAAYEQDRAFAFAIAKTITQSDGSVDLVVDASIFRSDADASHARRTLEHEAFHVVVERRGESLNNLGHRRGEGSSTARGTHSAICGVACEEYRVERALWGIHPQRRPDSQLVNFEDLVTRFDTAVRQASIRYQQDLDIEVICRSVTEAFHALATSTAYVAAELDGGEPPRDVEIDPELYARSLGEPWRRTVVALRALPPADVPTEWEALEAAARDVGVSLEAWLEHVGFALTDVATGALHFAVLNPEVWVSWADLL